MTINTDWPVNVIPIPKDFRKPHKVGGDSLIDTRRSAGL